MRALAAVLCTLPLAACSITGLSGAGDSFSCPFPGEASCRPMSEVWQGTASAQVQAPQFDGAIEVPRRIPEKTVRILIGPMVDEDGDLHEAHAAWVTLEKSRWAAPASAARGTKVLEPLKDAAPGAAKP